MWQELWACTIHCIHRSTSSQLDQTVTLQEEMRTSESEQRRSSMALSKLQLEHTKVKSQYERKSTEVTRLGKELDLARQECARLREVMMRGGVKADFDPLRVEDALSAMNEAEVNPKP
jgi:chromosome segregation ATPase